MIIEKCKKEDCELLVTYINNYWQKDHILARRHDLLEWQHLNKSYFNFYVSKYEGKICGILGFIPSKQYDSKLIPNKDYFGAIWSVNKYAPPATGHYLMKKMLNSEDPDFIGFVGISEQAKFFYKKWDLEINYLRHYYILNNSIKKHKIFKTNNISLYNKKSQKSKFVLKKITNLSELNLTHKYKPYKSINFLINRYQKHPIYRYSFYGLIDKKQKLHCIFVIRKQFYLDSSCLRIVDIYGDINKITTVKHEFEKLLRSENSEYVDLLNYGITSDVFFKLGFSELNLTSHETIVPNFFHPFIKRNVKIEFSYKSKYEDFVIFRGDGDQDRPS